MKQPRHARQRNHRGRITEQEKTPSCATSTNTITAQVAAASSAGARVSGGSSCTRTPARWWAPTWRHGQHCSTRQHRRLAGMGKRASKVCGYPTCTALSGSHSYCDEHKRAAWQGPRTASTGTRAWRVKRAEILCRDLDICQLGIERLCTSKATEVHHLRECAEVIDDSNGNLIAACHECRAHVTARSAAARSHGATSSSARRAVVGVPRLIMPSIEQR